jgi:uncharacterized membrane protein
MAGAGQGGVLGWVRGFAITLAVVGSLFRFAGLGDKVFWFDEAHTGRVIAGSFMWEVVNDVFDNRVHTREELLVHQFPRKDRSAAATVRILAREDPRQTPLYFVLVRTWTQLFGPSVVVLRAFSALFGVLCLPLVFLLARELFGRSLEGWVAVALVAVSPIFVAYSQEARQYALWIDLVILASWLLLRALRRAERGDGAGWSFALYGVTIGLALYAHLLTVLVMAAHFVFVVVLNRFRPLRPVWMTLAAQLVVSAVFWPWARLILVEAEHRLWISWAAGDIGLATWLRRAASYYARVFFDINDMSLRGPGGVAAALTLMVAAGCVVLLVCCAPRRARIFTLLLGAACSLPLIVVDLWSGGVRALVTRYQLPALLALELAVAFGLSHLLTSIVRTRRWVASGMAVMLVACATYSDALYAGSQTWWNKGNGREELAVVRQVDDWPAALIVASKSSRAGVGLALSIAHQFDKNTRILLVVEPGMPVIPEGFENVFLWRVTPAMRDLFLAHGWGLRKTEVPDLLHAIRIRSAL